MKYFNYVIVLALMLFIADCKEKPRENKVSPEQINIDRSTNYRYILKDSIEKEKKREAAAKKDPFKD
jgi:hypothetical protein